MMKIRGRAVLTAKLLLTAGALVYCICCAAEVRAAVSVGIERCIYTVIPSLYAMMILSAFLTRSGLISAIYAKSRLAGDLVLFAFSQVAGYPVGAKLLSEEAARGTIPRRRAELFAGACCGAGPAFVFGCVSSRLYGSDRAGIAVVISAIAANAVLALFAALLSKGVESARPRTVRPDLSAGALTAAVAGGGSAMTGICFMVAAFSVLTDMLRSAGIIEVIAHPISEISGMPQAAAARVVCAFLDVTAVSELPRGDMTLLPVIAGLVSFGGLCVLMQIAAAVHGRLDMRKFAAARVLAGILSGVICRYIAPYLLRGEVAAVSTVRPALHSAPSPVPSVLLILMSAIVIREYSGLCKKPETC